MSLLSDIAIAIKTKLGGTSINNTIPRYDGTTCTLKKSNVTISDTDVVTAGGGFVGNLTGTASNATLAASATKLATARFINGVSFDGTANITIADPTKAPLVSPALTGTPTSTTATDGTNTTQIATTAFVQNAVGGYLSKAITGGTVTLTEAEASNPVIAFSGALTSAAVIVVPTTTKRIWAIYNATSGAFTLIVKTAAGNGVTVAQGKRNLVYTDGTHVYDAFNDYESITLTGVSSAPTAAVGTNTTQLATTAFVNAEIANDAPTKTGSGASGTWGIAISGNAASATKLATARTIGGVSFDGSANINLPGVNTAGNQSTTGNAGSATKLATAITINGVAFDGTANITVADSTAVKLTENQTIAGIKTFTSSPIVPTPTTDYQVATKKYVDSKAQLSSDEYQGAYGISWDYATDTYIRTGAKGYTAIQSLMRRCVVKADGTVNYYLHPTNSNFKEDGTPSVLTGADGNVMVEIPKHYVMVETVGNVDNVSISLTPELGYVLDPAFLKWNGIKMVEVPYRYFRAYEGFVSGGKLLSVSGVTPTRSQTIATFRTQAMANGVGWHLTDWNLLNTIKRLCYIEFCDFIVTKYLGEGNHAGGDFGITTGQSNALGNRSSNSTHNDKYMSYRGIENMYADIWEFVDGVNVNNYQFYVNGKYATFASDVFTGDYVAKGPLTVAEANNSLIKRCAVSVDGGFIPTVIGGSTTTFYGDALWSATGAKIALYGGHAHNGASAGLGALAVNNASSNSDVNFGAAVCR